MIDSISTNVIKNCTADAIDKYPDLSLKNSSDIQFFNRSDALDILSDILTQHTLRYSDTESHSSLRDYLARCLFSSQNRKPYELPWEQKTIWSLLFGAMLVVAISGNCIVLWIVLAHRRMRTITNLFLLNLSISDLLMASLNCVFNFIFMLDSDWPFGALYCTVNNFIANVSVSASVFTLVAITIDRYIAIVRPLQHRTSRKKARIFLLIIWAMSCVLAAPCLMYSSIQIRRYLNGKTRTVCYMLWPDGSYPSSKADYVYNIVFLILTYLIPIIIMLICYSLMGRELWGSRSIGEHTERQLESMKSKRKVVRMFVVIVVIFSVCWLPYHLFFIYSYHNNQMTSTSYVQHLYLGFYWLAMSNSMVNPIIYYWMNGRFRVYFQQIICFCCLKVWKSRHKNDSPHGILLGKNSHSDMGRTRSCRQKTLSVRWRQNTPETRLRPIRKEAAENCNIEAAENDDEPNNIRDNKETFPLTLLPATATVKIPMNNNNAEINHKSFDYLKPPDANASLKPRIKYSNAHQDAIQQDKGIQTQIF